MEKLKSIATWVQDRIGICDPCVKKVIIVAVVCGVISAIVF